MKKLLVISALAFSSFGVQAQCNHSYGYPNNTGWTMNGGNYTIGPNTFSFNATPCAVYNYATYQLPCTLNNTSWCAEIDFTFTARSAAGVAHSLMSFTQNTLNSWNTNPNYTVSNNSMIEVYLNCPINNPTSLICARSKAANVFSAPTNGIAVNAGNSYRLRLQRLSATQGMVSVFTPAGALVGSECFAISASCLNLQILQHGCIPQGSGARTLTGTLDNMTVSDVVPGITGITGGYCPGSTSTLCVNSICGATSYTWSLPAGSTINSGQGTNCISVTWGTTSGNVSCTTAFTGSACSLTQTDYANIFPSMTVNLGPDFTLCCGTVWWIGSGTGVITGGTAPFTYSWSPTTHVLCPTCLSTQLESCGYWYIGETINYTLTVTDANGCTASDVINVSRPSCRLANPDGNTQEDQSEVEMSMDVFSLMPNPASENITINFAYPELTHVIEVVDMLGNVVIRKEDVTGNSLMVDLSNQAKGVYLVRCEENGKIYHQRLVVE